MFKTVFERKRTKKDIFQRHLWDELKVKRYPCFSHTNLQMLCSNTYGTAQPLSRSQLTPAPPECWQSTQGEQCLKIQNVLHCKMLAVEILSCKMAWLIISHLLRRTISITTTCILFKVHLNSVRVWEVLIRMLRQCKHSKCQDFQISVCIGSEISVYVWFSTTL